MSRRSTVQDLRRTVDRLPLPTRMAMLRGIREERIIVGAYTDGSGGVCPMLAAHRRGGRTSQLEFARTWDRFTRAPRRGTRPAKDRELRILERHLRASIAAAEELVTGRELRDAIAEHRALVGRREREEAVATAGTVPTGTTPPARRIGLRMPAWMRPIGSVEEYERALAEVDRQRVRLGLVGDTAGPEDDLRRSGADAAARERSPALAGS
jgi:hypothetical protein